MENKEIITPEEWLKQRDYSNSIISHPMAGDQYVASVSDAMREFANFVVNSLETEKEPDTTPTPAVDELNLEERASAKQKERYDAGFIGNERFHYKQGFIDGYTDSTHHNHASFVALVEGENTHVQDLYAENKKLANLLKFILDIDAMTTMEFCNAYRKDHPTYKGIVDLAVMEMFAVDSNKWHLVKDRAKEIRKWLTEFENKIK